MPEVVIVSEEKESVRSLEDRIKAFLDEVVRAHEEHLGDAPVSYATHVM